MGRLDDTTRGLTNAMLGALLAAAAMGSLGMCEANRRERALRAIFMVHFIFYGRELIVRRASCECECWCKISRSFYRITGSH